MNPLCACGCGQPVGWNKTKRAWSTYRQGHSSRVHPPTKRTHPRPEPPFCACGCGTRVKYPGARFAHGHHLRLPEYQRKPRELVPLLCQRCGQPFLPKNRSSYKAAQFCSRTCARSEYSLAHTIERQCPVCGKTFRVGKGSGHIDRRLHCSRACRVTAQTLAERPGSYRQNAYKTLPRVCRDCGWHTYPEVLVVHHIDGNRANGTLLNLCVLCPTCHAVRHFTLTGLTKIPSYRSR